EAEGMDLLAKLDLAGAAQHGDDVLVDVLLQRRVAARGNLEVAQVKRRGLALAAGQLHARHAAVVLAALLVRCRLHPVPAEAAVAAQHARTAHPNLRPGADLTTAADLHGSLRSLIECDQHLEGRPTAAGGVERLLHALQWETVRYQHLRPHVFRADE